MAASLGEFTIFSTIIPHIFNLDDSIWIPCAAHPKGCDVTHSVSTAQSGGCAPDSIHASTPPHPLRLVGALIHIVRTSSLDFSRTSSLDFSRTWIQPMCQYHIQCTPYVTKQMLQGTH
eukprot:358290-Amphidinium_carterae.1